MADVRANMGADIAAQDVAALASANALAGFRRVVFAQMRTVTGIRQPSSPAVAERTPFRQQASDELGRFLTEQLALEKQLAALVEDAYGLTREERQLLRDTRPVRDPIDVLEGKLAGIEGSQASLEAPEGG